jgi:HPr kinase/phosphorylase
MAGLTVEELFTEKKEALELLIASQREGLKKTIVENGIDRPGLALAGFTDRFSYRRVQVLGETELVYLSSLSKAKRKNAVEGMLEFDVPCIVITKGQEAPAELLQAANRKDTVVLISKLSTTEFIKRLDIYLDGIFAPSTTIHGTLVDVYGVGLLYTGKSGIGKSECALDLVERGHRLVADDMIKIIRRTPQIITGSGNDLLGYHMEIRGVGIIDIEKLFGIRAIRLQKRIEVEVRLVSWEEQSTYERLGLEDNFTQRLGVEIPLVTIPVSPGKNITVISEVIAMNHMLKVFGTNPALQFQQRLAEAIQRKEAGKPAKSHLFHVEGDFE